MAFNTNFIVKRGDLTKKGGRGNENPKHTHSNSLKPCKANKKLYSLASLMTEAILMNQKQKYMYKKNVPSRGTITTAAHCHYLVLFVLMPGLWRISDLERPCQGRFANIKCKHWDWIVNIFVRVDQGNIVDLRMS
jgi:hypothetical protein